MLVISCRCRLGEDRGNWGCVVRERPQQREPHRCEQRDRSKTDRHNEKGILCDGRELFPTAFRQPGSVVGTRSQRMNLISHLLVNLHRTRTGRRHFRRDHNAKWRRVGDIASVDRRTGGTSFNQLGVRPSARRFGWESPLARRRAPPEAGSVCDRTIRTFRK